MVRKRVHAHQRMSKRNGVVRKDAKDFLSVASCIGNDGDLMCSSQQLVKVVNFTPAMTVM